MWAWNARVCSACAHTKSVIYFMKMFPNAVLSLGSSHIDRSKRYYIYVTRCIWLHTFQWPSSR